MSIVWAATSVTDASEVLVLLAIADRASADGVSFPSLEEIAQRSRRSERQVIRLIRRLEENGVVQVRKAQRGRRRFSVYRIDLPGLRQEVDYDRLGFPVDPPFDDLTRGRAVVSHDTASHDTEGTDDMTPTRARGREPIRESSNPRALDTSAGAVLGFYIDVYRHASGGDPPARIKGQMAKQIKGLLEEGQDPEHVAKACALLIEKRLNPGALASLLLEAAAGPKRAKRFGHGVTSTDLAKLTKELRRKEAANEAVRGNGDPGLAHRSLPQRGA